MPPRIAIPVPTSTDLDYNRRAWPAYADAVTQSGGIPVEIPLNAPPAATARLIATCQGVLLPGSPADVNPQKYGQEPTPECNPADPARENVDELLLQDAHNLHKPIFAICFGTQMLNVWRGGTLLQHLTPMPVNHAAGRAVAVAHTAVLAPGSLLAAIAAETQPQPKTKAVILSEARSAKSKDLPLGSHHQSGSNLSAAKISPLAPHLEPRTSNLEPRLPINSSHHQAIAIPGDGLLVTARSPEDAVIEAVETAASADVPFLLAVQWHPERTYSTDPASRALFIRFVDAAARWSPKPQNAPNRA